MTSTSVKNNFLPPGLVSNLQEILSKKNNEADKEGDQSKDSAESTEPSSSTSVSDAAEAVNGSKPTLLVTNGDGIESPGLVYLVEALVREGLYNVHVCAPQSWVLSLSTFGFFLCFFASFCAGYL
jgi:5'-nucleotidase